MKQFLFFIASLLLLGCTAAKPDRALLITQVHENEGDRRCQQLVSYNCDDELFRSCLLTVDAFDAPEFTLACTQVTVATLLLERRWLYAEFCRELGPDECFQWLLKATVDRDWQGERIQDCEYAKKTCMSLKSRREQTPQQSVP